jgi:hypothetical protein
VKSKQQQCFERLVFYEEAIKKRAKSETVHLSMELGLVHWCRLFKLRIGILTRVQGAGH